MNPDEERNTCTDCDGTGYTSDGGNVFPCWCEIGCEIADQSSDAIAEVEEKLQTVQAWEK